MTSDPHTSGDELLRTLAALARTQATWLADLDRVLPAPGDTSNDQISGDPSFAQAFRRWAEELAAVRWHLYRCEGRLLHFVISAPGLHRDQPGALTDGRQIHRRWRIRLSAWFQHVHLDPTYRLLDAVRDLDAEPVNADLVTDLATLAEVAETTAPTLERIAATRDLAAIQDLAFYRVISPWRITGRPALDHTQRWLDEMLAETEEW